MGISFAVTPIGQLHQSPASPVLRDLGRTKILEPPIHLDPATNYFTPSIEPPGI